MKSDFKKMPQKAWEEDFYLWLLSQTKKLTSKNIVDLLGKYKNAQMVYKSLLSSPFKNSLLDKQFLSEAKSSFENINEDYISILDDRYPTSLKNIYDPPLFLYYRGNISLLHSSYLLTIVGSRTSTDYHRNCVDKIVSQLSETPLIITSGLAIGIDALAHQKALTYKLATIAVLGSGLSDNIIYPQANLSLAHEIIKDGGLLLSEQNSHTKTRTYHFPKRNRILAALSKATIVISGAKKSGTLITAQLAVEYGKEVLALPGNINLRLSQCPNQLIKEGAILLNNTSDILKLYNIDKKLKKEKIIFKNKDHAKIYTLLQTEPMKLIDLAHQLNLPLANTSALISEMEIKGLLKFNNINQLEII